MTLTTPIVDPLGPEGAVASALARNVEPFTTTVVGYDTVVLSWTSPALGSWLGIQIVRSRSGFPRTPDDGVSVLNFQHPGWNEENSFTATGLTGGYNYFSLFLKDAFGWHRVAEEDALIPYDYNSTDRMWDTIPEYYRTIRDDTADISKVNLRINPSLYDGSNGGEEPNLLLSAFISLFGWGFDLLRTQAEYLANGYDPTVVHTSRLRLLAQQFGYDLETAVPTHVNRTMVRNLTSLYRKRGTLDGIHDILAAVSGWDVEVSLGLNLLLSDDQAEQTRPDIGKWSPTVRYSAGDIAENGDYTYISTVSNNLAVSPPTTQTNNANWTYLDYPRAIPSAVRADTGDINTWQLRLDSGGSLAVVTPGRTKMVVGAPDVTGTKRHTSALQVFRTESNGSVWADAISVPGVSTPTKTARQHILEAGIPVPKPKKWVASKQYRTGDYVVWRGAAYAALNDSVGIDPSSDGDWLRVGADDRVTLNASLYAHGPFTGSAGTGGKTVAAEAFAYQEDGTQTRAHRWSSDETAQPKYFDAFVDELTIVSGATGLDTKTVFNSHVWNTDGNWAMFRSDEGGKVARQGSGKSHLWVTNSLNSVNVAVTWTDDPGTTPLQGIVFRRTDANNFWIATQTGLFKVVAGAARANPSTGAVSWTKFTKGQRMKVMSDPTSPYINVYRNDVLVGSTTDNFNSGATNFGLGMEA